MTDSASNSAWPACVALIEATHHLTLEARPANKTVLFDALAAAGITLVTVTFDGGGDAGQIESIVAQAGDRAVDLPAGHVAIRTPRRDDAGLNPHSYPVAEVIERMAYDCLGQTHRGWENNDGAFGTFIFDVVARTITLEFYDRFMEIEYSEHEF